MENGLELKSTAIRLFVNAYRIHLPKDITTVEIHNHLSSTTMKQLLSAIAGITSHNQQHGVVSSTTRGVEKIPNVSVLPVGTLICSVMDNTI